MPALRQANLELLSLPLTSTLLTAVKLLVTRAGLIEAVKSREAEALRTSA